MGKEGQPGTHLNRKFQQGINSYFNGKLQVQECQIGGMCFWLYGHVRHKLWGRYGAKGPKLMDQD